MVLIQGKSLADLASRARSACDKGAVTNLVLRGTFPYEEAECEFVMTFDDLAEKWQSPTVPDDLFISHGSYIHRYGDAKEFLVAELTRKRDSNRACLSLINMQDLINSGDAPIPSFLVLQFGFAQEMPKTILVTAYFRALEVREFLPINLAEICQVLRHLKDHLPEIEHFELTIVAFRAHSIPGFHCLRKASLDTASAVDITVAVQAKDFVKLRAWLDSKINVEESVIWTAGLTNLSSALQAYPKVCPADVLDHVEEALADMERLRTVRVSSSHSPQIRKLSRKIQANLSSARDKLA